MLSQSANWGCCSERGNDDNCIQCSKCRIIYHYACVYPGKKKKPVGTDSSKAWNCPQCREAAPRVAKSDNTPIRQEPNTARASKRLAVSSPQPPSPSNASDSPVTREEVRDIMDDVLQKHMSEFMRQFTTELVTVKDELKNMKQSLDYVHCQLEDIMKESRDTQAQIKLLQERDSQAQSKIMSLEARLNQMEQHARCKNIEIQCVPEKKSENLISVVEKLSKVVGCQIKVDNILNITRTAKLNPENKRPRSIVVEFNTPLVRDGFLASTIQYNRRNASDKLNSIHLGYTGPKTPVFVTEHLSPHNKTLHAAARRAAKEKGYQFVWIRSGRIFMRKDGESEFIVVKDTSTIANLK